jgi:REG-2-like HAD superfamily hydrolase
MPTPKALRPSAPVRAVFFDAGNTLFFESPSRFEIYAHAARDLGLAVSDREVREAMYRAHERTPAVAGESARYTDRWFRAYVPAVYRSLGATDSDLEGFLESLLQRYRKTVHLVLFPDALATLDALRKRGLRLAILSNWSARLAGHLETLGLSDLFDFVMISAVEGIEKPSPAFFARACERAGVAPHEALHVGDHPVNDVRGARSAGIQPILIDRGTPEAPVAPEDADVPVIRHLHEVLNHLGGPE